MGKAPHLSWHPLLTHYQTGDILRQPPASVVQFPISEPLPVSRDPTPPQTTNRQSSRRRNDPLRDDRTRCACRAWETSAEMSSGAGSCGKRRAKAAGPRRPLPPRRRRRHLAAGQSASATPEPHLCSCCPSFRPADSVLDALMHVFDNESELQVRRRSRRRRASCLLLARQLLHPCIAP